MLILFSGVPCSGKSTLATITAQHFKIPCFSKDNLQAFLFHQGLVDGNTVDGYRLLFKLAEFQLNLGVSVMLDATFPLNGFRQQVQQIAEHYQVPFKPIHCHISDHEIWKERWHRRKVLKTASHWMDFTWEDVLDIQDRFQVWEYSSFLSVDAINPLEQNMEAVKNYLNINY